MIQPRTVVTWVMPILLGLAAIACTAQPLVRRSETITPARDPAVVEAAILKALANRGWIAQRERPGSLLATLDLRTHQVVTRITYSGSGFEVDYVSSKDMGYTKDASGQERIHRNYNGWVANVVRDTEAYLEGRQPDGGLLGQQK
jgi:hypothetical protein